MQTTLERPTTIDLETATDLRPVSLIARNLTGKRPSPSTVWRWVKRGNRGGKLDAVMIGGSWHTTPGAFAAFVSRQTAAAFTETSSVDASDATLAAAGLL